MTERDPHRLVKYVATGAIDGVLAGWVFVACLLALDLNGIWTRAASDPEGPLFVFVLFALTGISFGMLGIAWRVMVLLPGEKD